MTTSTPSEIFTSLRMENITKTFGTLTANHNINLSVSSGEVLGLLGENGAGKTTLMNILYGLSTPDSGRIFINRKEVAIRSPKDSMAHGIGMVHQHFMLIDNHTVLENLVLGDKRIPFFFPLRTMRDRILMFCEKYGFHLDPDKKIWELSAGEQQKVEILKALFKEAYLLIMDEPTSVLTPGETEELFKIINRMTEDGRSVIYISHKLDEVQEICGHVLVLRKGEVTGRAEMNAVTKEDLARLMIGREVMLSFDKKNLDPGEEILTIKNLTVTGDRGNPVVHDVSFSVHKNEIFGIAGVSGNGQREVVEGITGLRKVKSGSVILKGSDITNLSARVVNSKGITHVPEERMRFGIVPNMFIYENAILKKHHTKPFSRVFFLDHDHIQDHAKDIVSHYKVDTPSIKTQIKNLSGGNIQKLIIGRELVDLPDLLVASHPTYGLDIGATEYIRLQLLKRREQGGAILLVSEDLEELLTLCDTVAVFFKGEIMGIIDARAPDIEKIGLMMTGLHRDPTLSQDSEFNPEPKPAEET
ncbi:MAG: ABC transporter ATP-binding protein [Spirochaetales bacterium]|nr:ABC transporter ATP-binding protein [Spirochaetales bacterium]